MSARLLEGRAIVATAVAAAIALAACGQSYAPANVVENLRVLAIRAEPPELRPGDTASLDALVADPKGGGRALAYAWGRCSPPGAYNDLLLCLNPSNVTPLSLTERATVTAPPDFLDAAPRGPATERILIVAFAVKAGDEQRIAFKELLVTKEQRPLNRNPRLVGAQMYAGVDDGGVTSAPLTYLRIGGNAAAVARYDPTLRETYTEDGGVQTEDAQLSFFTTAGQFDFNRVNDPRTDDPWSAPAEPTDARFWVVLRDNRDGTDWLTFSLPVR